MLSEVISFISVLVTPYFINLYPFLIYIKYFSIIAANFRDGPYLDLT
jgi:hypothetical protein